MRTLGEVMERNAYMYPGKEALIVDGHRYNFRQVLDRAKRLASGLYQLGLRRQDRISILAMNCAEYFDLFCAGNVAGYLVATVNFRLASPETEWVLSNSEPKIVVFEEQYAAVIDGLRKKLPHVTHYICIGAAPPWARSFDEVFESGVAEGPPIRSQPDDYALLIYTSGTTGRPKGAIRKQWRWVDTASGCALASEFSSASRVLLTTPAFHCGLIGWWLSAWYRSATVVVHRTFDPVQALEAIQSERITFTFIVAAMLQAMLDVPNVESYDVSSMYKIVTAGAPIPVPLLKRAGALLGPIFGVMYGSTETAATTLFRDEFIWEGTPEQVKRIGSVGHAQPGIELRVVDQDGKDCPPGVAGEVWTYTTERFDGYWNNTAATIDAIRDGWVVTGDIGYLDEEGYLFLVDRKKDMIISGGENIYSREVEEAVLAHPDIIDVAVIGVPHPKWVETVKAIAVRKSGSKVREEEIIIHCKTLIASYKCPKFVEFMDELPRVASGKINKVALREREQLRAS